jgi:CheY-like chemotaxis protein
VIRVRDNGKGIPEHMLGIIFDLFVQSDDTLDRADGGMGLGLTLVKTLVSMHGGRVSVHSEGVNKGSEFVVRLPLAKQAPPPPPNDGVPKAAATDRHLLIVEDNPDSRAMLEAILKLEGYRVSVAENGSQGVAAILHQRPDVAIVDIGLPGMNGYEVAGQVRRQLKHDEICLIALTGYGRPEDRAAAFSAGFDAHLVKPLKPDELSRLLTAFPKRTGRGSA